ncbi:MAG: glycosyltransferase family 4 protein [Planctomycetes bacterium]|nr:glycosyltransferase family 4 protein [Planctomycetota bacterium]
MHVALVTSAEPGRGNRTTVDRWVEFVRGFDIEVVAPGAEPACAPDVVDGYHAVHGGPWALELARRFRVPLVISLGGTDLFAPGVEPVLLAADCVTGAFQEFGERLRERLGRAVPYAVVPRGVRVPDDLPLRAFRGRVLLPAGLRPVKDVLLAIDLLERLRARGLPLALRVLGPAMDRAYAAEVRSRAGPFVAVGEAAPADMREAYLDADVVWNTSLHEGGSNALLEAVAHGCAIFARDVPGNSELLREEGAPGALFDPADTDAAEAFHRALHAETEKARRARVAAGHAWLRRLHDPRAEAAALERIFSGFGRRKAR